MPDPSEPQSPIRDVARGTGADPGARGVYGITVAAELVDMPIQTLRLYEARGLLDPARSDGGTRRYSAHDIDRLRHIGALRDAGINLAGIGMVLDLEQRNARLQAENEQQRERHNTPSPPSRSRKRITSTSID